MNTFVDAYTFSETIEEMKKIIDTRTITQHVVVNANKINLMYKNERLKSIINQCPLINADGQSIIWSNRILKNKTKIHRVTGIDLLEKLVEVAEKEEYRIYYLGAKENTLKQVIAKHKSKYKNLQIAGYHHGYFDKQHCEEIVSDIRNSNADILFVAFPSPEKEFWLDENKFELNVPLQIGVGGSFDVLSGEIKRAPLFVQKMGMEWFYRWIHEPKRLFKRYFVGNILFLGHLIKEYLKLS
ncbi:MAG: WecB/TagA/CpsF family glycosyltransferase [Lactobacillus sp.]|nr:WecB/TagA/CpsF family glycosyltransferase [Lactobacillus sp.]